jgi:hypothetical protein
MVILRGFVVVCAVVGALGTAGAQVQETFRVPQADALADPSCSGEYGCSGGTQYRCTIDTASHTCKWQKAAASSGGCSGAAVTPGSGC